MWLDGEGWVLDILLGAVDFTRCPSKTVRRSLFGILRDAWQLRPSLQVSTHNTPGGAVSSYNQPGCSIPKILLAASIRDACVEVCCTFPFTARLLRALIHSEGQKDLG